MSGPSEDFDLDAFSSQLLAEGPSEAAPGTMLTHEQAFGADPWTLLESRFLRDECSSLDRKLKRAQDKIESLEESLQFAESERKALGWVLDIALDRIQKLEGMAAAKKLRVLVECAPDPSKYV